MRAENISNLLQAASTASKSKNYQRALTLYDTVLESNEPSGLIGKTFVLCNLGQFDQAEKACNHAVETSTDLRSELIAYASRGILYYQMTNFNKATEDFDRAIRIQPKFQSAYIYRANIYYFQGRYELSLMDYSMAALLVPNDPLPHLGKGKSYSAKQEYKKAIEAYNKVIELDTNSLEAYQRRGDAYSQLEDLLSAIKDVDKVLQLSPTNSMGFACRGDMKSRLGDFKSGIADCEEAVHLNTNNFLGYNNLAWLLAIAPDENIRDGKKAVEYAERACNLTTWTNAYCLGTLAATKAEIGDFVGAVEWERKCIAIGLPEKEMKQAQTELLLFEAKKPYHAAK